MLLIVSCLAVAQDRSPSDASRTHQLIRSFKQDTATVAVTPSLLAGMYEVGAKAPPHSRIWLVAGGHVVLWTGSFIALNKAWYAGYPRSSFHFFNDNGEWNQMDKAGHTWTAYQMSRASAQLWKWAGLSYKKSAWLGAVSGLAYQSIIEIQDGFSSEWGFSWGDMLGNASGSAIYLAQQLGWKDQRIQIKLSYWSHDYPADLRARRDQLFGSTLPEQMLKDYNSQTYWASVNLRSFFPQSNLPKWLNLSLGYGSEGMLGGYENKWTDQNGIAYDRTDIPRVRRFFLAPDVDFTKIKTSSRFLRSIFFVLNLMKAPTPAIELNGKGKWKVYAIYF